MDGVETVLVTVVPDVFPDAPVLHKVPLPRLLPRLPPPLSRLPVLLRLVVLLLAQMVAAERILVALLVPVRVLEIVVVCMGMLICIRFPFFETCLTSG